MKKPASLKKTSSPLNESLLLVGAGKMGLAMLNGWFAHGFDPKKTIVFEPQPSQQLKALTRRGLKLNPKRPPGKISAMVIAVKPQSAMEALSPITKLVGSHTLVLSIMAGRTLEFLQSVLPANSAIVRAMPNTPASIGRSITVAIGNDKVSARQRKQAVRLLAAIGTVQWIENEKLMDAVTALSGSGPAYVFLLTESMTKAGIAAGLPQALAALLARETVAGAGELLARSAYDAATLRENVTSPGGTTAAALAVLMGRGGLDHLLRKAIAAATKRSKELAG